jgi:hypothetical protein
MRDKVDNKSKMKINYKGIALALLISTAITFVWYGLEWIEFGELQWNRGCDNIVYFLYTIALAIGFSKW